MQRVSSLPIKIPTPWASGAQAGFTRAVPNASQIQTTNGAASWIDGFVPLNFTAVTAGGIPPFGKDMNGALNQVTGWSRWAQAGGPIRYDQTFQGAIGGYPAEARIGSNTIPYLVWQSTIDNNLTNPDAGGGGWQTPVFPDPGSAGLTVSANGNLGANLAFVGNGTTTPKKWLRVINGEFSIINNAYSAEIFTVTDFGDVTNIHNLTAGGIITASSITALNSATISGSATVGVLHVLGTPASALISGNAAQIDGNLNVNTQIVAGTGLYAGNWFSPNSFNGREWYFQTDANGNKFQVYRANWYDQWASNGGARYWQGGISNPSATRTLMSLDGSGNLFLLGQAVATTGLYAGSFFSPNDYNNREWSFSVDRSTGNVGNKYQSYQQGWYDQWTANGGARYWLGGVYNPNGSYNSARVLMTLDGGGNFTALGQVRAGGALYAETFFQANGYNGGEWNFSVDSNPQGNPGTKYEVYRLNWVNYWSAANGDRGWTRPDGKGGNLASMLLSGGTGDLSVTGGFHGDALTVTNKVEASYGRLANGARGNQDGARVVNLNDYEPQWDQLAANDPGFFTLPNGMQVIFRYVTAPSSGSGLQTTTFDLGHAFNNNGLIAFCCYRGNAPPANGVTIAAEANGNRSVDITTDDRSGGPNNLGVAVVVIGH